jgi:formiminoglutamase
MQNTSEIFDQTTRPRADLFASRHDPNDPRMGEYVRSAPEQYASTDIVIIGCPQDEGVRRNSGRPGAAAAPDAVRKQFFKLTTMNMRSRIFDLGNILATFASTELWRRFTTG